MGSFFGEPPSNGIEIFGNARELVYLCEELGFFDFNFFVNRYKEKIQEIVGLLLSTPSAPRARNSAECFAV
jgi:hypothetical protein